MTAKKSTTDDKVAAESKEEEAPAEVANEAGVVPAPDAPELKPLHVIAREVLAGDWGVGTSRRLRLARAGYNFREVQDEVNLILRSR